MAAQHVVVVMIGVLTQKMTGQADLLPKRRAKNAFTEMGPFFEWFLTRWLNTDERDRNHGDLRSTPVLAVDVTLGKSTLTVLFQLQASHLHR